MNPNSKPPNKKRKLVGDDVYSQQQYVVFPHFAVQAFTNPHPKHSFATGKEIFDDISELWDSIYGWVLDFLDPIIDVNDRFDSTDAGSKILNDIRNNVAIAKPLHRLISDTRDFKRVMRYPNTDYALLEAILIRFLIRRIFEKGLFDKDKQPFRTLQVLENGVLNNTREENRDLAVQLWRHMTYKALINSPPYLEIWKEYLNEIMTSLRQLLGCFRAAPHFESAMNKFQSTILPRATEIHQNMVITPQIRYSFQITTYQELQDRKARVDRLLSKHEGREDVYSNVLQFLKSIKVGDIDRAELDKNLNPLCTFRPRLQVAMLGDECGNYFSFGEEIYKSKSKTFIAYGDDAERRQAQKSGSSLLETIYKLGA